MNLSRYKWKTAPRDLEPVTRRIELSLSVMGKTAKGTGFGGSIKSLCEEAFCQRCLLDTQGELLVNSFGQMSLNFKVDKEQDKEEAGGNVNLFSLTYFCQPVFCSGLQPHPQRSLTVHVISFWNLCSLEALPCLILGKGANNLCQEPEILFEF